MDAELIIIEEYNAARVALPKATMISEVATYIGLTEIVITSKGVLLHDRFNTEKDFREAIRKETNYCELVAADHLLAD